MQCKGYAHQFASEYHEGGGGGQALGALAFVAGFPGGGLSRTHGGVIEQTAQFRGTALGQPAATAPLAGVAGAAGRGRCRR